MEEDRWENGRMGMGWANSKSEVLCHLDASGSSLAGWYGSSPSGFRILEMSILKSLHRSATSREGDFNKVLPHRISLDCLWDRELGWEFGHGSKLADAADVEGASEVGWRDVGACRFLMSAATTGWIV